MLLVAAHPDDETVGAGALLAHLPGCALVHLTGGVPADPQLRPEGFRGAPEELAPEPRPTPTEGLATPEPRPTPTEAYARARRAELLAALALAGIVHDQITTLAGVDQEVALAMPALTRALEAIVHALRPAVVITHPYEGGHPDHDAAALIVHAVVARLHRRGISAPTILEMTSYHAGDGGLVTGEFLLARAVEPFAIPLTGEDLARKRRMLACFATQREVLAPFTATVERFRPAPAYDFTCPPHGGLLHYERLGWPLSGARFRELAAAALRELDGVDGPPSSEVPCR